MIPRCHLDSKVKSNFEVVDICYYLMCPICSVVQEAHPFSGSGKKILGCLERKNTNTQTSYSAWNVATELAIYQIKWGVGSKFKTATFRLYCSRFPPGRSCWHGLCSCSHRSTAGVYHRIVGASGNTFETQCSASKTYKTSVNRQSVIPSHTQELPGPGRSRESQKEIGGSNVPNCCSPFSLVQNTWHMVQMCGNAVFNIMITMNSVTMDKHAPFWEQIWPLGLSIIAAKRGKTTLCRIPIMKMRSGPPRPHSTLKTWQTKRQIWAFDFQPGVICVDDNKEKCSSNLFVAMQAPTLQAMLDEGFNAALDTAVGALDWFEHIETMMEWYTNGVALQGKIIS